jgi:alpha-N-arabinofuranosidase
MPTCGAWEREVLEETYDVVDFISAHAYYWESDGDLGSFLASSVNMDRFIEGVAATADAVGVARKSSKKIQISFDEWNVWYQKRAESKVPAGDHWPIAPALLEDRYNVADAVVVGSLLISLLRHTDRVHAASLAQLVNVIAPIMTEPGGRAWRQTTFHPFALTARHARGDVLRVAIDSPVYQTAKFGDVALVDAVATHDEEAGEVAMFVVNRAQAAAMPLEVDLRSFGRAVHLVEAVTLANSDHLWHATADDATSVAPRTLAGAIVDDGMLRASLAPLSWSILRLSTSTGGNP